ncbi:sugar phosphate nucleotidyltransferase [Adlercreutzia sp. ZJ242]|uniref:sugar phosphate nucleotidyltransferase n=1 Tax=Adlercreutzia sp. ZJ242 TaxID=2709409 RepID=UPI0013EBC0FA|nr:sugar phosphate nucleotidyltransferase [Adlercreutzia sp. ZJ242]
MSGSLEYREFKVLEALEAAEGRVLTQREIAQEVKASVGTVNKTLTDLVERGYVSEGALTGKGRVALEPYRVKRAVFVAAGFGSRLVPITLNTPKPLVRVHGQRIIDLLLDAVVAAGIEEIYIVRGYYGEQFDQLLYKYPTVKFLENPMYNEANNISSLMVAKYLLSNAYVIESDLLLSNPKLISKYQYHSNYLGIPMERSDDWCFKVKKDVITDIMVGGEDCWQMVGISYWSEEDGRKLVDDIPATFNMPGGKERYWDEVPLRYFSQHYQVHVRECSSDDIVEIDTFKELQALDSVYA